MMTNTRLLHVCRRWRWLWAVCAVLLMTTQQAWGTAVEDTYRYSATIEGMNQLRFKFPVYDYNGKSADHWGIGTIYIQIADGSQTTVLTYEGKRTGSDNGKPKFSIRKGIDGNMVLYRAQNYSSCMITTATKEYELPSEPDQSYSLAEVLKQR